MTTYAMDFETWGNHNLPKVGLANYLDDPEFDVLLAAYYWEEAIGAERFIVFDFITDPNAELDHQLFLEERQNAMFYAHNSQFEQGVCERMGYPMNRIILDTAVISRAAGASSSLDNAAEQLLNQRKHPEGQRLVKKFSMAPTKPTLEEVEDDPDWQLFKDYVIKDAKLSYLLQLHWSADALNNKEHDKAALTQSMNRIGWTVDVDLVKAMQRQHEFNTMMILDDFKTSHTSTKELNLNSSTQLTAWCKERGVNAKSFNEESVKDMIPKLQARVDQLRSDVTAGPDRATKFANYSLVLDMLKAKQALGGSSHTKLKRILELVDEHGQLKNQYMHLGAQQTHRTTGVGAQLQNIPRLGEIRNIEEIRHSVRIGWDNNHLSENMRQIFTSSHPDGELIVGDFSAIDSRALAELAGEDWKRDAYRNGQDVYTVFASKIFHKPYNQIPKDSPERNLGKVGELGCGYGASGRVVAEVAKAQGTDLSKAAGFQLVDDYRQINPMTVQLWHQLEDALSNALSDTFASIRTPSGYMIHFEHDITPKTLQEQHPGAQTIRMSLTHDRTILTRVFHGVYRRGKELNYYKPDSSVTGKPWKGNYRPPKFKTVRHYNLYGGKLAGILTQSFARELFFEAMQNVQIKFSGSRIHMIGQFHDELVLDWTPDGMFDLDETIFRFKNAMEHSTLVSGFPLKVDVNHAYRYIK